MTDRNEAGSPPERDRPELEIKLTPDVIEAGMEALRLYHPLEDSPAEIVEAVFLAMRKRLLQRR